MNKQTAGGIEMSDKMREAFEKWAKMRVPYRALKELDDEGEYDDQEVRMMWCAWQAAQSVPVVGEAVAYLVPCQTMTGGVDMKLSFEPSGAFVGHSVGERVPLYAEPPTSITQAELDAKDARISELEFVIEEIIRINHYDFRGHEIAHAVIAKENGK